MDTEILVPIEESAVPPLSSQVVAAPPPFVSPGGPGLDDVLLLVLKEQTLPGGFKALYGKVAHCVAPPA
jgi:hypothetical protein